MQWLMIGLRQWLLHAILHLSSVERVRLWTMVAAYAQMPPANCKTWNLGRNQLVFDLDPRLGMVNSTEWEMESRLWLQACHVSRHGVAAAYPCLWLKEKACTNWSTFKRLEVQKKAFAQSATGGWREWSTAAFTGVLQFRTSKLNLMQLCGCDGNQDSFGYCSGVPSFFRYESEVTSKTCKAKRQCRILTQHQPLRFHWIRFGTSFLILYSLANSFPSLSLFSGSRRREGGILINFSSSGEEDGKENRL